MKNSILLSICALFFVLTSAKATDITGNISSSTTWTVANSPYIIKSNINVNANATLTIESGVVVKFDAGRYLQVRGTLNATGVSFTANDGVTKGFWDGIYVSYSSYEVANVNLTNCTIEYASTIYVRKGQLTLSGCLVDNLQTTVEIHDLGVLNIDNTTISNVNFPITYKGPGVLNMGENVNFNNNTNDYIDIDFSTISQVLHLKDYGYTYHSDNNLTVSAAGTLQIDPGVNILMANVGINVNGKINAVGTQEKPIVLDRTPPSNYWYGLSILNSSIDTACVIKNTVFRNARYTYSGYYTALRIDNASPTIDSCTFESNTYNLLIEGDSKPLISNCIFGESISTGSDVYNVVMDLNASPIFVNDSIKFNTKEIRAIGLKGSTVTNHNQLKKIDFIGINNISYCLYEETTIHDTASLVIDPGIVIKSLNYAANIRGNGVITGIGTVAEPIIFTHIADDNYGNPLDSQNDGTKSINESAGGRIMLYSNAESKLENWIFNYAGYGDSNWAIYIDHENVVENCEIKNSYNGIWFTKNAQLINNTFGNIIFYPIGYKLAIGTPNLSGNTISNGYIGVKLDGIDNASLTLKKMDFAGYSNIPYILANSLTIPTGNILTINPGIIVKSTYYNGGFTINGAIKAIGTKHEKIIFTSLKDDSAGGDTNNDGTGTVAGSDWRGFEYKDNASDTDNILRNVEIRYTNNVAVSITDCRVLMDSVKINFSSQHAIGIFGNATPEIKDCDLFNISYEPIYMDLFAEPTFTGDNKLANCGIIAIKLRGGTVNGTVPIRSFAGYSPITYTWSSSTLTVTEQLTIPAGLTFKGPGRWLIKGKLAVEGTAANPVVFTTLEDDNYGFPKDSETNGVKNPSNYGSYFVFEDSSDDLSTINYALFRYSYNTPIQLNNASPIITNSTFEDIIYEGLSLVGNSAPAIEHCVFNNVKYPFQTSILTYPRSTIGNTIIGSTGKGIRIGNETLTQDATLKKRDFAGIQNIPYALQYFTVGTAATLTIEPGIIAKFENSGYIRVRNGLIALGGSTTDSTIVFTSIYDDFYGGDTFNDGTANSPHTTSWNGIYFYNESIDESCLLDHCIIKYASSYYGQNGAVTIDNASPSITNCRFEGGTRGIVSINTSMPLIENCDFLNTNIYNGYALLNTTASNTITATNCWFNSDTGPSHSSNPSGTGERVSDYVVFTPFTTQLGKAELGDVSLNGNTSPYDASLILQHIVSNITLNQTQQDVADVSRNGTLSSYDASLILQYNVDLIVGFGPNANMVRRRAQAIAASPSIAFTSLQASPETDEFIIPIEMNTAQGVKSLDLKFDFNPSHIQLLNVTTSNINQDILLAQSDNTDNGKLAVSLTSAYDLSLDKGMIYLKYKLIDSTIESSEYSMNSVVANESAVTVETPTMTIPSRVISNLISTSIDDNQLRAWVNSNALVVQFDKDLTFNNMNFKLLDISSRIVVSRDFNEMSNVNNQIQIPLSALGSPQNGVYLIQLNMDGMMYSKKIVINKQ